MIELTFVWDKAKNTLNKRKHDVSFEKGESVFADENALFMHDPDHSETEDRFLLLGLSAIARLLVVCHCHKDDSNIIRIISVWKATKSETAQYVRRRKS